MRKNLYSVEDEEFLFLKMSSSFEQGMERQLLTIAIPAKCLNMDCYHKKFKSHIDTQKSRDIGVNLKNFSNFR